MPLLQDDGSTQYQSGGISLNLRRDPDYQSPYLTTPRKAGDDLTELVENFGADFNDNLAGIGAIGSGITARMGQTMLPPAVYDWSRWGSPDPSNYMPGAMTLDRNLIQPGDFPMAGAIGQDIASHYWNDYIAPLLQGDTETPLTYAKIHPLNASLDILPGAGMVGKAAKAAGVTKKLADAARKIPGVVAAENNIQGAIETMGAARRANNSFLNELTAAEDYVKEAYEAIPDGLRGEVLEAGELRDYQAYERLKQIPEVQEFWKRALETDNALSKDLIKAGAMTEEEWLIAKYGPVTRNAYKMSEADLATPQGLDRVRDMKANLDALGVEPTYMGILFPKTVTTTGKLERGMFQKTPNIKATMNQALPPQLAQPGGKPAFLRPRESGARDPGLHEYDAYKVWSTRYRQGLQFLKMREFFYDALKNPKIQAGSVQIDVGQFFKQLGQHSGMEINQLNNFLKDIPEKISVPPVVAAALKNIIHEDPAGPQGLAARTWAMQAQVFKTFALGLDMFWAVNQTIQNGMIAQVAMWRSPRDVAATMLAHIMAFDPKVRAMLPKNWMTDAGVTSAGTDGLMGALAKFAPPMHWYMDKVFKTATAGDNYWRGVIGIYNLMRSVEELEPAMRVGLTDAFKLAARQQQIVRGVDFHPAAVAKAGREIEKWMGQYDELTARMWATPRAILPFFLWYKHAFSVAMAMTTDTPVKNMVLASIEARMPAVLQDDPRLSKWDKEHGVVMLKDQYGDAYRGPNRGYLTKGGVAMTPFGQAPELARTMANIIFNQGKPITGLVTHPNIQMAQGLMGQNPGTGMDWKNPALNQSGGQQWDPFGMDVVDRVSPPPLDLFMRSHLPRQEAIVRAAMTPGKVPSDFPGEPKRDRKHKAGYKAFDPLQQAIFTALKQMPHEQGFTTEESDAMDRHQKTKAKKLNNQQRWRRDL